MSHPPHLPFDDTNNIWWVIQKMELLLRSEYAQQVTAHSTEVTALYMNICDEVESPFQVSVSSSGSKHYKPYTGQINTENIDLDRRK
jgi:hypothetical protein